MEHTPISPAGTGSPPAMVSALPDDLQGALALHGLRQLLFAPIPKLAEALADLGHDRLGQAVEVMIALMDVADGDPDAEADDRGGETVAIVDDPDLPPVDGESDPDLEEGDLEDSFVLSPLARRSGTGAGCQISDPGGAGEGEDDERDGTDRGDISWAEWHTLPAASRRSGRIDGLSTDSWIRTVHEDDEESDAPEEDDGPGQSTEDENSSGQCSYGWGGPSGPGCPISDPDFCAVERGELTSQEGFIQGCGSAPHECDDDEPKRAPPEWPLGDGDGFQFRPPLGRD